MLSDSRDFTYTTNALRPLEILLPPRPPRQHLRILLALPENSRYLCYLRKGSGLARGREGRGVHLRWTTNIFRPTVLWLKQTRSSSRSFSSMRVTHFGCVSVYANKMTWLLRNGNYNRASSFASRKNDCVCRNYNSYGSLRRFVQKTSFQE